MTTLGIIVGNRGFFPAHLCETGRREVLRVLEEEGIKPIAAYVGEGRFTTDKLDTFGGYGVIEVPNFQRLLQFICRNGYEHHVAATKAAVAGAINDALTTYLGWQVYHHEP